MNDKVRDYILNQVTEHPTDITAIATKEFNVSRQTIVHYLNQLSDEGLVVGKGNTKARRYELKNFVKKEFYQKVDKSVEEDVLWREKILPLMDDLKPNVIDICQYGFTEIVRNVLDHSESKSFLYSITRNAMCVELDVFDHGIGIFNKIQRDFNLNDPRNALLELAKGKLTSDQKGIQVKAYFLLLGCLMILLSIQDRCFIAVKVKTIVIGFWKLEKVTGKVR